MTDYEETFHPNGTDGDDVEEVPSKAGWFDDSDEDEKRKKKDKDKGWCFLTTAACEHIGLPDDCYELQTLRDFRDNFLCATVDGAEIVEEYYRIAPPLVPLVKQEHTAAWVWKHIQQAVAQIENGQNSAALDTYQNMVRILQREGRNTGT